MSRKSVLCLSLIAAAILLSAVDASDGMAQLIGNSPMSSVVAKTNETRQMLVSIGKAAVGVVAAILFLMALGGRVAWHWVIMVVVAGAGLTGLDSIVAWINS